MMKSAMLQRQLRFQAVKIKELQSFIQECKENCGWAKNEGMEHMLEAWRKSLKVVRKQMSKMDELQRFTKAELKEAYFYENFGKTWEAMPPLGIEVLQQCAEDDVCDVPPEGWQCTRQKGHEGPCAAYPISEEL